jgi:hypothetical protein
MIQRQYAAAIHNAHNYLLPYTSKFSVIAIQVSVVISIISPLKFVEFHNLQKCLLRPTMNKTCKDEKSLNNAQRRGSYLTGNTLRLRYKAQPVNAV